MLAREWFDYASARVPAMQIEKLKQSRDLSFVEGDERIAADKLLDRKYFLKVIFNVLTKINRHTRAMIKIEPA